MKLGCAQLMMDAKMVVCDVLTTQCAGHAYIISTPVSSHMIQTICVGWKYEQLLKHAQVKTQ